MKLICIKTKKPKRKRTSVLCTYTKSKKPAKTKYFSQVFFVLVWMRGEKIANTHTYINTHPYTHTYINTHPYTLTHSYIYTHTIA
jgi:hypothetical protein